MNFEELIQQVEGYKDHPLNDGLYKFNGEKSLEWIIKEYRKGIRVCPRMALDGISEYGLMDNEALLVLSYTGWLSKWLNSSDIIHNSSDPIKLSRNKITKENIPPNEELLKEKCRKLLTEVLTKFPPYNHQQVVRHRPFINVYSKAVGATFTVSGFLSTYKENASPHDCTETDSIWLITTKENNTSARDISKLHNNPTEEEVIFIGPVTFEIEYLGNDNKCSLAKINEL